MSVGAAVAKMQNGDVVLLENSRFYPEEEKNDPVFAKQLADNADIFVNDAFGTAHRAHASTEGVTAYLKPAVAGFLLQKVTKKRYFVVLMKPPTVRYSQSIRNWTTWKAQSIPPRDRSRLLWAARRCPPRSL